MVSVPLSFEQLLRNLLVSSYYPAIQAKEFVAVVVTSNGIPLTQQALKIFFAGGIKHVSRSSDVDWIRLKYPIYTYCWSFFFRRLLRRKYSLRTRLSPCRLISACLYSNSPGSVGVSLRHRRLSQMPHCERMTVLSFCKETYKMISHS